MSIAIRIAVGVVALTAALAPGTAADAAAGGKATLTLKANAAKQLRAGGVKVGARGGARRAGRRIALPAAAVAVGKAGVVRAGGSVRLRSGRRAAALKTIRIRVRGRRVAVSARLGKRRVTLLTGRVRKGRARLNAARDRVRLTRADVSWTRAGTRALARSLRGKRLRGRFGVLRINAYARRAGGGGSPTLTPIKSEPAPSARPATAVDVASATLVWHVRDSFIQYVNSGEGTSASAGATSGPKEVREGTSEPLVYTFGFPFTRGWYDPPSGRAAIYYRGAVNFKYSDHGIDLDAKDPEIELSGSSSRAIMRFAGRGDTNPGNKRAVLVNLHPAGRTVSGRSFDYGDIPGTIPKDTGANVFAGFYQEGDPFGSMRVAFTTK